MTTNCVYNGLMTERLCSVCKGSIEKLNWQATKCFDCKYEYLKTQERKRQAKKREDERAGRPKMRQSPDRKSVDQGAHRVNSRVKRDGSGLKEKEVLCKHCFNMSWVRKDICGGCGGLYAPEPPSQRAEPLGSSMGTTVGQGKLYGYSGIGGGHHAKPNKTGRL